MNIKEELDSVLFSGNAIENFKIKFSSNAFKNAILKVLPEVEDCYNDEQNNPWHIYSVMNHILKSCDNMFSLTTNLNMNDRRILLYTMFYHDIGKPNCRVDKIKNGKLKSSYHGHNLESVRILKRSIKNFHFNQIEEKIIEKLVEDHDIFMFLTLDKNNEKKELLTKNVVQREIERLNSVGNGKLLIKFLILIGRADSGAQNPKMTKESFDLLNEYEKIVDEYFI